MTLTPWTKKWGFLFGIMLIAINFQSIWMLWKVPPSDNRSIDMPVVHVRSSNAIDDHSNVDVYTAKGHWNEMQTGRTAVVSKFVDKSLSSVQGNKNEPSIVGEAVAIAEHEAVVTGKRLLYKYHAGRMERNHTVIYGVLSAAGNPQMRQNCRDTWLRNHHDHFFLVAGNWTLSIQQEMNQYQDLLWLDMPETYDGLTYKSLVFFQAVHRHATEYEFAYKTDDDVYVDVNMLQRNARDALEERGRMGAYFGRCQAKSPIIRDPNHKWYVHKSRFPKRKLFRPYAIGAGYGMSKALIKKKCFSLAIRDNKWLPIEDVNMGEVARNCGVPCKWIDRAAMEFHYVFDRYIALYEIKIREVMQLVHIEFCLDQPIAISCQSLDLSCANPAGTNNSIITIPRSTGCRQQTSNDMVYCAAIFQASTCGECMSREHPFGTWQGFCSGDCRYCPNGGEDLPIPRNASVPSQGVTRKDQCIPLRQKCWLMGNHTWTEEDEA